MDNSNKNKYSEIVFNLFQPANLVAVVLVLLSISSTYHYFVRDLLISYGDTESHLNIAKRVVDSLTPGLAQLGGIWLPLPHLLLVPVVNIDFLWRTGIAGSIVSGLLFVAGGVYLFRLTRLITGSVLAGFTAVFIFATNPNILYLQSTAMTEIPLIAFFIISTYYYVDYIRDDRKLMSLIAAGFFGLAASLSRYDGWFLVIAEAALLILNYTAKAIRKHRLIYRGINPKKLIRSKFFTKMEAVFLLFSTLSFVGIIGWFIWDYLILNDPLYFTNSPFSAKSQQTGWLARGELPSYKNLWSAISYYTFTSYVNIGKIVSIPAVVGLFLYLIDHKKSGKFVVLVLLSVPYFFYVVTLFMGQSVIFIPELTPDTFEYQLFNVRYGVMMIPAAAFFAGYLFSWLNRRFKLDTVFTKYIVFAALVVLINVFVFQPVSFVSGSEKAITIDDGVGGLSSAKKPDAQDWIKENYDGGLVLIDDYARTVSIIKSGIPMENVIYVGNKPYWEESLEEPEKHARWIITQTDDAVWDRLINNKQQEERLYKYFQKAYTSPEILIFKKADI